MTVADETHEDVKARTKATEQALKQAMLGAGFKADPDWFGRYEHRDHPNGRVRVSVERRWARYYIRTDPGKLYVLVSADDYRTKTFPEGKRGINFEKVVAAALEAVAANAERKTAQKEADAEEQTNAQALYAACESLGIPKGDSGYLFAEPLSCGIEFNFTVDADSLEPVLRVLKELGIAG